MNDTIANPDATTTSQELAVREKKELPGEEKTIPGRFFVPSTDVYETEDGLTLVMGPDFPEMSATLSRVEGVPVDIRPVFETAEALAPAQGKN